jgi:integrase
VDLYIERLKKLGRSFKTVREANRILDLFAGQFLTKVISEITSDDLISHMSFLRSRGLSERTISNHIIRITALLRKHKIVDLLGPGEKPQYDEPEVEAYDADQLKALFAAVDDEERLLFEFFLGTGLREQEVMNCSWQNIDFKNKSLQGQVEADGRVPHQRQTGTVRSSSRCPHRLPEGEKADKYFYLVFPGPSGRANGHFLRLLKGLALRAGLNCGECVGKPYKTKKGKLKLGRCCATHPTCKDWGLHKFWKTFATLHNEAGVPMTTMQRWLGHSDLATTLRYIAIADLRSERTRSQVNATFASFRTRSGLSISTDGIEHKDGTNSTLSDPLQTRVSQSQKESCHKIMPGSRSGYSPLEPEELGREEG